MTTQAHGGPVIPEITIGTRLKLARKTTGMDIREFAEQIGVSKGTVFNVESDRVRPRKIVVNAYSLATGVPVEWLETGHYVAQPDTDPAQASHGVTRRYRRRVDVAMPQLALVEAAA